MTEVESQIARELFACAAVASHSEQKRAHLIALPQLVLDLAQAIANCHYKPGAFTIFAVTDPKLREIFAPGFADRLAQQWLIRHIEPSWDKRFIDDSFANRKGKGTQAAIDRLQTFMRRPGQRWYLKLDIQAFFPSIDRRILLELWSANFPKLHCPRKLQDQINGVATAIIEQSPTDPAPVRSGNLSLLSMIPAHKSLLLAPEHTGMPIGSLTSQFFANVYLNELDQYIKHTLKAPCYLRYVDDFILLADDPKTLLAWKRSIATFLHDRLRLALHPSKVVLQRCAQGVDFLGYIVHPHYKFIRQRSMRALRRRIAWFCHLLSPQDHPWAQPPMSGEWRKWLVLHDAYSTDGSASAALLQRMLSTLNSYYGLLRHANTYTLRKHIYHKELRILRSYFLPADKDYSHLKIRAHWLMRSA